ncbi:WD40-repeat-containing domain protein [Blastocladiella britannica]|nr:WD40-repeat-containing domain protein [Blastocladiella britannica]
MDIDERKRALELKRQKLAELRRVREERSALFSSAASSVSPSKGGLDATPPPPSYRPNSRTTGAQVDALVSKLLSDRVVASSASSVSSGGHGQGSSTPNSPAVSERGGAASPAPDGHAPSPVYPSRPNLLLQATDAILIDLAPVERVYYSKEMQTDMEVDVVGDDGMVNDENLRPAERPDADPVGGETAQPVSPAPQLPPMMPDEIKRAIVMSEPFHDFMQHSAVAMEKALTIAETFDFLRDYTISQDVVSQNVDVPPAKLQFTFAHDQWTKGRTVSALSWNPRFPELVAAAYTKSTLPTTDSDGLVLVWNLLISSRPEFVLVCQSEVRTSHFSDYHPHLIVGGTYSGQIVIWDTRKARVTNAAAPMTNGSTHNNNAAATGIVGVVHPMGPALKTPLSAGGHTHPVACSALIGSEVAHQLVTASSDGTVCAWQLDMLAQPQEVLELTMPIGLPSQLGAGSAASFGRYGGAMGSLGAAVAEVGITCFAAPGTESASLWVGTEHGSVLHVSRYDRAGSKAGVTDAYIGHSGTVTGIAFHRSGSGEFADLFLTSSVDWTVKLWRAGRPSTAPGQSGSTAAAAAAAAAASSALPVANAAGVPNGSTSMATHGPLFSFLEAGDYVFDVAWSPSHPAVFASVDGSGHLDLWNLNEDTELYVARVNVSNRALNKVAFSQDGRRVSVGGATGQIHVFELAESFHGRDEDWPKFSRQLALMQSSQEQ